MGMVDSRQTPVGWPLLCSCNEDICAVKDFPESQPQAVVCYYGYCSEGSFECFDFSVVLMLPFKLSMVLFKLLMSDVSISRIAATSVACSTTSSVIGPV